MSQAKIICTVTNDLSYDQRMIRICTALSKHGYDVTLVGRKRKNSIPISTKPFQQKRLKCIFNKGALFYAEYNLRLFFFLLFQPFDLVCAVDLDTILPATIVSKFKRKKSVYDAHEYFTEVPELIKRPRVQRIWEGIARFCVPKMDICYTVCNSLAALLSKRYDNHFQLIRNVPFSYNLNLEELPAKNKRIILYQGALNDGRGLEQVIEAMSYIEGAVLEIAGEGDLSKELRELVKVHQVENKVSFLGYLTPEDLKNKTLEATIGLNLLKNKGLNYYYSLANKTFDYIHAEVPAIHMGFPEYIEINTRNEIGILIEDLNVETVAAAIHVLLNDEAFYSKLKSNCKAAKEIYNWELESKQLIKIYDTIFSKN